MTVYRRGAAGIGRAITVHREGSRWDETGDNSALWGYSMGWDGR